MKWFYLMVAGFILIQVSLGPIAADLYAPGATIVAVLGSVAFVIGAFISIKNL